MIGLYIHVPFCDRKCFYCSFVIVVGQSKQTSDYIACLKKEAMEYQNRHVASVYIGGGTPSTCTPDQFELIFDMIHDVFHVDQDAEITVEANPEGLDKERLSTLKSLGVNRLSMGIQSLNDDFLQYLGRIHSKSTAIRAYELVRQAGFANVNCDLMYSLPNEDDQQIIADIDALATLGCDHISLYALTLEPHSRFYVKDIEMPSNQQQAQQYKLVVSQMKERGYHQYEVSNFCRPGYESKHNINYWQLGDYIGLGVSAHSHMKGKRWENVDRFNQYMQKVMNGFSPHIQGRALDNHQQLVEALLFGLRMTSGVDIKQLEERFSCSLDDERLELVADLDKEGLLYYQYPKIRTTDRGMIVLDEICARLI